MMRWFAVCAALLVGTLVVSPRLAQAQNWVTPELCRVVDPVIRSDLFFWPSLQQLQERAAQVPNGTGRFWRITSPSGAVSHLWGTFHSSEPLMLDLPAELLESIAQAKVVALELDPIYTSRQEMELDWFGDQKFRNPLENFRLVGIDPRIEDWVRTRTYGLGWSHDAPDYLKYSSLIGMLLNDPCSDFSYGTFPIQDSYIQLLGTLAGAQIIGLEPVDALGMKVDDPENEDLAHAIIELYGSYLDPSQTNAMRSTVFAAYLEGQIGLSMQIDRAHAAGLFGQDRANELVDRVDGYLVDERNAAFLTELEPLVNRGGVVIAIGAFHLPGAQGMVEMLRGAGFTVTRVPVVGEVR